MKSFLHTGKLISLMVVFLLNASWSAVQAYSHTNFKNSSAQETLTKADRFFGVGLFTEEYSVGIEEEPIPTFNPECESFPSTEIATFYPSLQNLSLTKNTFDFRYNLKINLFPFHTFL